MNAPARGIVATPAQHRKNIIKLMQENSYRHPLYDVFRDFTEMAALAVSNSVDLANKGQREERYMAVVKKYSSEEASRFPKMLGELTSALELQPGDVLGEVFSELDLTDSSRGQFFTPYDVCKMMAQMQVGTGEDIRARIKERGFVTVSEPACGAGAMVVAMADAMHQLGINYQQHMHVTAVDIDPRAVHMAYLQFSLLGIPAVVILGNALTLEEHEHWRTPLHMLGMWDTKLRRGYALGSAMDGGDPEPIIAPEPEPEPGLFIPSPSVITEEQMALF